MIRDGDEEEAERNGLTRRDFWILAGTAGAAVALPSARAFAGTRAPRGGPSEQVGPVMKRLSGYMSAAAARPLPAPVIEAAKQHLLDTLAAMISGATLAPGRAALQFSEAYGGPPIATVAAADFLRGPIEAAFTNGMLAHSDETDDSHAPSQSHPGCAVVPAALAVGERFAITGVHLLRAVTLGYDIGPRFTMTLGGQRFEAGSHWSTHSISPLFGAAAAAACAAGLNVRQMRWMLGYTAQQSSGLAAWSRDPKHFQKAFCFAGMTARNGVTSALLVKAGWTGVEDILSGSNNFFAAYNPHCDPAGLVDELGVRYEVTRTNIKKWPVGSPIQAALDALEALRAEHPFEAAQVRRVVVRLASDEAAIVNDRDMPDICLQHVIAVALLDRTVTFASVHDMARLKEPATLRERAKVKLVSDAELERLMPLRVAIVEVTLTDGTRLRKRVDNVRGTPRNPMTRAEVAAKATDLCVPVIGAERCSELVRTIFALERVGDVRELRRLLQRS